MTGTLQSIEVQVQLPVLPLASEIEASAIGRFADGTSADVTDRVHWSTTDGTVLDFNGAGKVVALQPGAAEIVAEDPGTGISASAAVTVTAAQLLSLEIAPGLITLALGLTDQLSATGHYSDGSEADLTGVVQWSSGEGLVAGIAEGGTLSALAIGSATVTATEPVSGVSAEAEVEIGAAVLLELQVLPEPLILSLGLDTELEVIGLFSDGSEVNLSATVDFSSTDGLIAAVDTFGAVLGAGLGATTIVVVDPDSGVETEVNVGVTNAVLQSLAVVNNPASLPLGLGQALTVIGTYSDGTEVNLTGAVEWDSDNEAVASVGAGAVLSGLALGSAEITVTESSSGVTASFDVSVTNAVLESLAILPGSLSLPLGISAGVQAIGTFSDASTQNLTTQVTWGSDDGLIASVTAGGLVAGFGLGSTTVTATHAGTGLSADLSVGVLNALLESITVTPANPNVLIGLTKQFTATGHFSDGSTANITSAVNWSSLNSLIALLLGNGLFSALGVGDVTLRATDPATGTQGETQLEACTLIIFCD